ncbi:hypothetical protein BDZ97DRAFT_1757444 [Flammula alnicola]|nr:hypothetical protein BDZ97DRAFT_1757444 [Flammula alnicola]
MCTSVADERCTRSTFVTVRKSYILVSWRNITAAGLVGYSGWPEQTPTIDRELLSGAVRFTKYKHFVNPSRASPLDVYVYDPSGKTLKDRGVLYTKDQKSRMAICLTTIFVAESQIMVPSSSGIKNKYIKGPLHMQEMERLGAFFCMCFNRSPLGSQFDGEHNLSFGTMGIKDDKAGGDASNSKSESSTSGASSAFGHIRSKGLLKAVQQSTYHQFSRTHTKTFLNASDTVPVYNTAGQTFKLPDDIECFDQLPRHTGEVPLGSCALVGYTASLYKSAKEQLSLATNLQFVIILAID